MDTEPNGGNGKQKQTAQWHWYPRQPPTHSLNEIPSPDAERDCRREGAQGVS